MISKDLSIKFKILQCSIKVCLTPFSPNMDWVILDYWHPLILSKALNKTFNILPNEKSTILNRQYRMCFHYSWYSCGRVLLWKDSFFIYTRDKALGIL